MAKISKRDVVVIYILIETISISCNLVTLGILMSSCFDFTSKPIVIDFLMTLPVVLVALWSASLAKPHAGLLVGNIIISNLPTLGIVLYFSLNAK